MLFTIFAFNTQAQIQVLSNGNSIFGSSTMTLDITSGSPYIYPNSSSFAGGVGKSNHPFYYVYCKYLRGSYTYWASDVRLKENFRTIDKPLEKILLLNGKKYDFIPESSDNVGTEKEKEKKVNLKKDRLGFIAQEVLEVIPEAVCYDEDIDQYSLDYISIIPVLVEAIKELNTEIEKIKTKSKEKSVYIKGEANPSAKATLSPNFPNPFSNTTRIEMNLPNSISNATVYIYNLQGKQIKEVKVTQRGNTSIIIEGYTLEAGMYLYTLIADGKEVDTKKMILTN